MSGPVLLLGHADSADTVNQFLVDLNQAFRDLGRPSALSFVNGDAPLSLSQSMIETPGAFAIDVNGKIISGNFPKLSLVVDHPFAHPRLAKAESRVVLGLIDQGHLGLTGRADAFIPHGGPLPEPDCLDRARDIDVLFVGNILEPEAPANDAEALALEIGRSAARAATDPWPGVAKALAPSEPECARRLLALATDEAQRLARLAALSGLRAPSVHVVGSIPQDLKAQLPAHFVFHGVNGSFAESRALMRRSRLVINVSQKFPRGSHERIWYAMAAGACVITNRSDFVEADFVHRDSILFYDDPVEIGDLAQWALEGNRWRDLAAAALPAFEANHTWLERAERILVAMIGRGT